jgi:two-component system, NarL family, response regulator LiaR
MMPENDKQKNVQILLVDDHTLIRRSMKNQFTLVPSFSVVGEAGDGVEAIELVAQLQPNVVLMDIDMPVMDGIAATQLIKKDYPATRVLALSAFDSDTHVMGMLAAGADGYCLKTIEWEQLIVVIQLILSGGAYLAPQIARKIAQIFKSTPTVISNQVSSSDVLEKRNLTERERQILKLIAKGYSNQEIADQVYLSLGTIKSHVRILLNKLSVDDRVQAAAFAVREGLV